MLADACGLNRSNEIIMLNTSIWGSREVCIQMINIKHLPLYLAVKHIFWGCLLVFHVPHECHAIWLVRGVLVVVVGCYKQLGVLDRWKTEDHNEKNIHKNSTGN